MTKVQEGDLITVIYDGILDDGEIFESSKDTGPLKFTVGLGSVMDAFEKGVIGMDEGESKEITVLPENGFGQRNPELIQSIERKSLGEGIEPQVGMILGMTIEKNGQAHQIPAMVTEMAGDQITVDYNHPLSGKTLTYKITVEKIEAPPLPSADQGCSGGCSCS